MRPSEICIGDFVKSSFGIGKVFAIDHEGVTIINKKDELFDISWTDEDAWVDFLPLTKERLNKMGIEKEGTAPQGVQIWTKYVDGHRFKLIEWTVTGVMQFNDIRLEYVHQVQQIMRMLGIRKEVSLW